MGRHQTAPAKSVHHRESARAGDQSNLDAVAIIAASPQISNHLHATPDRRDRRVSGAVTPAAFGNFLVESVGNGKPVGTTSKPYCRSFARQSECGAFGSRIHRLAGTSARESGAYCRIREDRSIKDRHHGITNRSKPAAFRHGNSRSLKSYWSACSSRCFASSGSEDRAIQFLAFSRSLVNQTVAMDSSCVLRDDSSPMLSAHRAALAGSSSAHCSTTSASAFVRASPAGSRTVKSAAWWGSSSAISEITPVKRTSRATGSETFSDQRKAPCESVRAHCRETVTSKVLRSSPLFACKANSAAPCGLEFPDWETILFNAFRRVSPSGSFSAHSNALFTSLRAN